MSHRSAGEVWRILEPIRGPVHVTTASSGRRRAGIRFHRARDLAGHRAVRERIPVTSVERTLLDLAGCVGARALRRAVEEAERLELLDFDALRRICDPGDGRRGTESLAALLGAYRPLPETDSELERRFLRLCRDAGLPKPAVRVPIAGFEVDCVWPEQRLVVELDGYAFHRGRASFERDRARDAALQLAGYRVLRITHRMLAQEPQAAVGSIHRLLDPIWKVLAVSQEIC